jgi:AcrR family transcriptional regulator
MTEAVPLPKALQAAWGLRERPTKGPRPALSVDRIVAAAIEVASAEGFAAVSMSRVAGELSTSAMTLYRYVASKDELAILMMEAATADPPESKAPDEDWRPALERWAEGMFAMFRRHPWFLQVPVGGPPATPRQLGWMETGLHALDGLEVPEGEKVMVLLLLNGYVRYQASMQGQMAAAARSDGRTVDAAMNEYGTLLRHLVQADRFPLLRRAIDAGVMDEADDADADFAFGLARVLDGVEALIRVRAGG